MLKGNGPCNRERLAARVEAWDDGAWVREARSRMPTSRRRARGRQGAAVQRIRERKAS